MRAAVASPQWVRPVQQTRHTARREAANAVHDGMVVRAHEDTESGLDDLEPLMIGSPFRTTRVDQYGTVQN